MIFTKKHLTEIEEAVGHSCEVAVLAGRDQGGVAIRVLAKQPDGQMFSYQEEFTGADFLNNDWESKFDNFKRRAKREFDTSFAS
ncbi:MAG: hypothetical protein GXP10_01230 [Gammaproteobacteria bacterium]|nr:hypothetical protein [Gammaproteobacteria bacterium]